MKRTLAGATLALLAMAADAQVATGTRTSSHGTRGGDVAGVSNPKTAKWEAMPIHPTFAAEKGLRGVLALLRNNRTLGDITPEKVESAMGVQGTAPVPGYWGFGARISPDWGGGFGLEEPPYRVESVFTLGFSTRTDLAPGTTVDATEICQLDFDTFKAELEAMGFDGHPEWGNPNQLIGYYFKREGFYVKVSLRAESMARLDHNCITTVSVR